MMEAGAKMVGSNSTIDKSADAEKYINDCRLLEIRCGVLEEEKQDYQQ
jgi:hypothetical protein